MKSNYQAKYREMVKALMKSGDEIKKEITTQQLNLLHAAVGISGEAGEVLDTVKKMAIYNQPLNRLNLYAIIEELGDIEFYMEALRQAIAVSREEVIEANIKKLSQRYPRGNYTNKDAKNRADK